MAAPPLPKLPGYAVSLPVSGATLLRRIDAQSKGNAQTLQQSIGDKAFFKNQTLSYLNGYQREEPNQLVRDLAPEATWGTALSTTQPLTGTLDSPSRGTGGSPAKLPQWVENDRKVR